MLREPVGRWDFVTAGVSLLALEIIVFGGYFTGTTIPQFDFIGAYNQEAFAWWRDGSFFQPAQWMPYMWGGYPSVTNLQNGSFYIPVGLASLVGPYTLHSSAIVSALHVGFGAVGMFVFARMWGLTRLTALLGLVAWFFASGFFLNATFLDIMRGWAWVPWIMTVASVRWPWRQFWSIPVAVVILWQGILGSYPGILVAFLFTVAGWVLAQQLLFRPRLARFLLPLALVSVAAALMSMLRFLPAILARGSLNLGFADESYFSLSTLGTILVPYDTSGPLPILQSYFLPAALVAALAFAIRPTRLFAALTVTVVLAIALGLPNWPWSDWLTAHVPGFDLSRFRASDFKVVMMFAVAALALTAIDHLLRRTRMDVAPVRLRLRDFLGSAHFVLSVAVVAGLGLVGVRYGFDPIQLTWQWVLLVVCTLLLVGLMVSDSPALRSSIVGVLVLATAASGLLAVESLPTRTLWKSDRVEVEDSYLGSPVDALIALREVASTHIRRPARIPPPPANQPQDHLDSKLGRTFYTGESSVYGYVNLRGTESYEVIKQSVAAAGVAGINARAFWSAAGIVVANLDGNSPGESTVQTCSSSANCGPGFSSRPLGYRTGNLNYQVTASRSTTVSANEAYYIGWDVRACLPDGDQCQSLDVTRGSLGEMSFQIPSGTWNIEMDYKLPSQATSWILFWGTVGGVAVWTLGTAILGLRRRTVSSHEKLQ